MEIRKQQESKDCGLMIIDALHKHFYKKFLNLNELRQKSRITDNGLSIASLVELGQSYGIKLDAFKANRKELQNNFKKYGVTIITTDFGNHYIIFRALKNKIKIWDPARGEYTLTYDKFLPIFSGIALTIEKSERIETKYEDFSLQEIFLKNKIYIFITISSLILNILLMLISSSFSKVILDTVVDIGDKKFLIIISLWFLSISAIKSINSIIQKKISYNLQNRIEIELQLIYIYKSIHASSIDLNKISIPDHYRRFGLIPSVSDYISNSLFMYINEGLMLSISIGFLLWISVKMFAFAIAVSVIIILLIVIFNQFMKEDYNKILITSQQTQTSMVELINSSRELKNHYNANYLNNRYQDNLVSSKIVERNIFNKGTMHSLFDNLLTGTAPIILTFIGLNEVFEGTSTVGKMMMFVSMFSFYIGPLVGLAGFILTIPQNKKNITLLKYVLSLDTSNHDNKLVIDKIKKIELFNVEFRYDKPLINIPYLKIDESIHIDGKNGAGKSTLFNILSKYIEPSGVYNINGVDSKMIENSSLGRNILYIHPGSKLPSAKLFEIITHNNEIFANNFLTNKNVSKITNLLRRSGLSFDTYIKDDGSNLSSGQKQVVLLMRIFTMNPSVVILDEALENIDNSKVKELKELIDQDKIFIEISRSNKYLSDGKDVDFEQFNKI